MVAPPHQPYSLTAPAIMQLQPDSAGTFKVVNSGTKPITVSGALGRYNDNAMHYPASTGATLVKLGTPWIQFSPAQFRLAPGQARVVRIQDHVPAGTQGHHYLNLVWTIQPVLTGPTVGGNHVTGVVGTSIDIPMSGTATPVTSRTLPSPPPGPSQGFPTLAVLLVPLLLILAAAAASVLLLRRARTRNLARR